ncbi:MAG: hypothetical protein HQK65_02255, partial [Desulfamplus sp.]|nr:hypothetical protein [Desulfamplus sp.]
MKLPATYSRASRQQILACDMAYALVLIYKEIVTNPDEDVMKIIETVHTHIKAIQHKLWKGGDLVLKNKDLKTYVATIKEIQQSIDSVIGTRKDLSLDFISGILGIVSTQTDIIIQKSKDDAYKQSWTLLLESLQSLYELYDPELEYESVNNNGSIIADSVSN